MLLLVPTKNSWPFLVRIPHQPETLDHPWLLESSAAALADTLTALVARKAKADQVVVDHLEFWFRSVRIYRGLVTSKLENHGKKVTCVEVVLVP